MVPKWSIYRSQCKHSHSGRVWDLHSALCSAGRTSVILGPTGTCVILGPTGTCVILGPIGAYVILGPTGACVIFGPIGTCVILGPKMDSKSILLDPKLVSFEVPLACMKV